MRHTMSPCRSRSATCHVSVSQTQAPCRSPVTSHFLSGVKATAVCPPWLFPCFRAMLFPESLSQTPTVPSSPTVAIQRPSLLKVMASIR